MAAKLTEKKVKINGTETTMLLSAEDVERYEAAGLIVGSKSRTTENQSSTAAANKAMTSPETK